MQTTDINVRSLKFAILQCLASGRGHQHKFNLIGKGYPPGSIESALGLQLDSAQRHLAVIAFNELEQAGLIRPTYTDLINPEAWVEITEAGRHALEQHVGLTSTSTAEFVFASDRLRRPRHKRFALWR